MPMLRNQLLATALVAFGSFAIAGLGTGTLGPTRTERRGAELYEKMCAVCHGRGGEGYKADQAPAIGLKEFLATANDDFLRMAIADGRPGTTMSAWAQSRGGPLSRTDVDALVHFLRRLGPKSRPRLDERAPAGDAKRGNDIYQRECLRCHGAQGTGGPFVHIGAPHLLESASNGFLRRAIRTGRPNTAMPAFEHTLSSEGVEDVVALLRSWQTAAGPASARNMPARPPPIPLGPVPLHPKGPEPAGFHALPGKTNVDTVHAELERGARMALLDARTPSDYTREHITGAVSVPFYDPDPYFSALPKNAWLVCYCSCPSAESGELAKKLVAQGFDKVTVLEEGLGVWKSRKYPTNTGQEP
jgi:cytochrome c oxidase cbb3-type subunit 3/ubiquinol-cytochrome c reductase cytochrome c subunit